MNPQQVAADLAALTAQVTSIEEALDDLGFSFTKKTGTSSTSIAGTLIKSVNYIQGVQGWALTPAGNFEANSGTFRGALIANSIDIPDTTSASSFHVDSQGNAWWGAAAVGGAVAKILKTGIATFTNINITGGSVLNAVLDTSVLGATSDITFSVTDSDTIAWSAGTIRNAAGATFSIALGNTGNMAALTYIYLDTAVSSTVLQTTTSYATSVGAGKLLVATAQNAASGGALCLPYLGAPPLINGAAQINASSILAAQISVAQLSAISANIGTITAGSLTLDTAGFVRGGATDYLTGTGIFIGYSGAAYKFSVGNPASRYVAWDGSSLIINGYVASSSAVFGGDGSDGALSITSGTTTIDLGGAALVVKNYTSIAITGTGALAFTNPSTNGTIIILKSQGNVTITSSATRAIDLRSIGGAGSTGSGGNGAIDGGAASDGLGYNCPAPKAASRIKLVSSAAVAVADLSAGGAVQGMAQSGTGAHLSTNTALGGAVFCGAGGAAASGNNSCGEAGGRGGGGLKIECKGALNISGTIDASGANGSNSSGSNTGGGVNTMNGRGGGSNSDSTWNSFSSTAANAISAGSGGGAGCIIILYGTLTANTGTYTTTGGSPGTATVGVASTAGADGYSLVALNQSAL